MQKSWDFPHGYEIRTLNQSEFLPLFKMHRPKLFDDHLTLPLQKIYSLEETQKLEALGKNWGDGFKLNLGLCYNDQFVGWSSGDQMSHDTFYMRNSAVFPEHRGKGLYKALMKRCVDEASNVGFQIIGSRHLVTNNAVLVPKLKFGFVITGFEVSEFLEHLFASAISPILCDTR